MVPTKIVKQTWGCWMLFNKLQLHSCTNTIPRDLARQVSCWFILPLPFLLSPPSKATLCSDLPYCYRFSSLPIIMTLSFWILTPTPPYPNEILDPDTNFTQIQWCSTWMICLCRYALNSTCNWWGLVQQTTILSLIRHSTYPGKPTANRELDAGRRIRYLEVREVVYRLSWSSTAFNLILLEFDTRHNKIK